MTKILIVGKDKNKIGGQTKLLIQTYKNYGDTVEIKEIRTKMNGQQTTSVWVDELAEVIKGD